MVPSEVLSEEAKQTHDSFSGKWERKPDFGHEEASKEIYVNWYLERYGHGDLDGLRAFLSDKGNVLDAGTGTGRDTLLYSEHCDGEVFGIDVSTAINAAYAQVNERPNAHLAQADLTQLPYPADFFDFIACDQVMHHTPDTHAAFKALLRHLKPGGEIAFYVYKKKAPIREFCDDFLRDRYVGGSEEECYEFSQAMTHLGKALSDLNIEFEVPEDIPILEIKAGKHNLQRFIYWHIFKCYWNDQLDFETNVMTNYDWYHPVHAWRHSPEEVKSWCAEGGLEIVHFDVVESGISCRARKV